MEITYAKLRQLKVDLNFNWKQIHIEAKIHDSVIAKINKDEYVKMENIVAIASYLNEKYGKSYDIGDLVEIRKDSTHK